MIKTPLNPVASPLYTVIFINMKRMHALEKAAMVTGFLSLVGLCSIMYYYFSNGATPVNNTALPSSSIATEAPLTEPAARPNSESFAQQETFPGGDDDRPKPSIQPSLTTVRKVVKAIPGFSMIRQTVAVYPTLKREAIKKQQLLEKLQEQEWKQLDAEESTTLIETEPPSDEIVKKKLLADQPRINERVAIPPVEIKPAPAKPVAKPLTVDAERAILEEANRNSASEINRKQQMKATGKMQVREMRKRPDGTLTDNELEGVFGRIVSAKGEQDSDASCVHIQSLPDTEKAATQISIYLRRKGFIMAGRGEAPTTARGIQVDATGKCITIIVGRT
jgi:hypothetical protein